MILSALIASVLGLLCLDSAAQTTRAKKNKRKKDKSGIINPGRIAPGGVIAPVASLNGSGHEDFSAMCLGADGQPVVAYVHFDGKADSLKVAHLMNGAFAELETLSEAGNIYQPNLARDGKNQIWCVWSELVAGRWNLIAQRIKSGKRVVVAAGSGNNVFADAKTDRKGRVWVAWQRFHNGFSDIVARHYDPKNDRWSKEIAVANDKAGEWEPRLAFGARDEALIVFDSYRRSDYDVYLARVPPAGKVSVSPIAATSRYEARADAETSPDGKTLWVAYEDGTERWGKDLGSEWRKSGGGLNYDRRIKVVRVNLDTDAIEKVSDITPLIPDVVSQRQGPGSGAVNLPEIAVDGEGRPWVFFRYCQERGSGFWQIAATRFDGKEWAKARTLADSEFCQDRRTSVALNKAGQLFAAWPSDQRRNKQQGNTGVYLARIDTAEKLASAGAVPWDIAGIPESPLKAPNDTPERNRNEHHEWKINGETYTLFWGDVHRHTDFSNCRTTDDGCIVEHFRYAIDSGGLDYLATSDHTEVGKTLSPYEWWQSQKLADIFQNPGFFLSLYAYEREQKWPYGHRNIVFPERGGPVIYIKRGNYEKSPWATPLPNQDGVRDGEIPPWQLWELLRTHGKRAVTIEHTSAGGMGTDWTVYDKIDHKFENIIELFQGSRESYEGVGAPQPRVVTTTGKSQFGKFNAGVWQNALRLGHRLGAYASSDHRSVHISYGGVYVKKFSRHGILDAMDNRLTVAATDKIFMEFSCNGQPLGSVMSSKTNPKLSWLVEGTAPIERITLIRNEKDYKVFEPNSKTAAQTWVDENPLKGENRYYLRIEQVDGNMGWTSPVWVDFTGE